MREIQQGEVYWIDVGPVAGSAPAERHPCRAAPGNVTLQKGDANLPKASVVNVSEVLTIDKSELVELIGKPPAVTVEAVRSGLSLLFDRV